MEAFPELAENDYAKITVLDEEWMKSKDGKERWRNFIAACVKPIYTCPCAYVVRRCSYENKVKDYNFGSLIRTDAREEYGERNTIFGGSSRLLRARPLTFAGPQ